VFARANPRVFKRVALRDELSSAHGDSLASAAIERGLGLCFRGLVIHGVNEIRALHDVLKGTVGRALTEGEIMADRPPLPPFTRETARQKVQAAEDAWNTRDPERVALAYTEDSVWRNRDTFVTGRAEIVAFLTQKWERELEYALRKALWAFEGDRIAVRFQYECRDAGGQWFRSYGNELWEFDEHGLMRRREASIDDVAIDEAERRIFGPRAQGEPSMDLPLH
jgi:nuclear transport factor 2 (NTF2) superfamily protein